MKGNKVIIGILTLAMIGAMLVFLPGCGGGEPSVNEIWERSAEAEADINSWHMDIYIYYDNTQFGSGLIETTSIDVSGDNYHYQRSIFGQSFTEIIKVGGKTYVLSTDTGEWTEQAASVDTSPGQVGQFSNLPSQSSSQENLGVEAVNGVQAYHLVFNLGPENVSSLFPDVPAGQLSANAGGKVDVWVDEEDYYKVKYEASISNVQITDQIGYGGLRIVVDFSSINQPISITPPV